MMKCYVLSATSPHATSRRTQATALTTNRNEIDKDKNTRKHTSTLLVALGRQVLSRSEGGEGAQVSWEWRWKGTGMG
jgi:hypothetical protein